MDDPNISTLQDAQNFTITGGEINTFGRDYIKNIYLTSNASTLDHIPPLSPLRPPSSLFTGRDTYLKALKDCFSAKPDHERKKFLLYGMGGIGKTQICLKFIEQYGKEWFSDIFWIDASSEQTVDLCLRQIAHKYKVDSSPSAEVTLEWISGRNDWLMVFDNADGGYHVVEMFIPPGNGGNILITSRDKALTRIISGTHSLEVTEMGEEEAIAFLLKSAAVDSDSVNVAIAQKLVAVLGCIPLAIDQAGAYMQSCGCELDYYLELFIKHRARLMSDKEFRGASHYKYSTYGTWEICIEEIKQRAEGENSALAQRLAAQSALILHNIFAFWHHDSISREIFEKAAVNFMKRKNEKTNGLPQSISWLDSNTLFLSEDGNWNALQFQAGIGVLLSFSLIRKNDMLYSVHPLIQMWSRDRIPAVDVSDCCQKSRSILACSLQLDYKEDNYRLWTLLAPHIKMNDELAAQWISDDQYYDDQNERFALVFDRVGDWGQTENLWHKILNARKTMLGTDHLSTINAMGYLASTFRKQGKYQEAEKLEIKVMEGRKEKLGPFHPDTLAVMSNLATTYWSQGNWKEAEKLEVKVMEGSKERLGPFHPYTLNAMAKLASTYRSQGNWKEAESLQVKVVEGSKEKLGPLHPDTLTAMANLARTYWSQGNWKEAESLQVKVMEGRNLKEKNGSPHPDTLTAMANLATTYWRQGNWKEAENLQVKVMEGRKEKLGPFHPYTLTAMANLASTYRSQGNWKEAESLQVKVMEGSKEKLGPLHPDTLNAMANLARTYWSQGNWKEAESLQVKVMEGRKEKLGSPHPDTLTAMSNLAWTYWRQGTWKEAESLQVKVMEGRKEKLGPFHPDTLTAMADLARTYCSQENWKEAESLQVDVMEGSQERLGTLHPDTITAMAYLARTYFSQGSWKEAESLQVKVMEARKERLGTLHPDTLTAMADLALTYRGQNKVKEAKELLSSSIKGMQQVLGVNHPKTIHYKQILTDSPWNKEGRVKALKKKLKDVLS